MNNRLLPNLTEKFLCKIVSRFSPILLNLTLKNILQLPLNERSNLGSLTDFFFRHAHLFVQIEEFLLPGYLNFNYNNLHFEPIIDTGTGLTLSKNSNIHDLFELHLHKYDNYIIFYTALDLMKRIKRAMPSSEINLEISVRINDFCSIFEAEALTISHAIEIISEKKIHHSIIFTDSLSVLSSLNNPIPWIQSPMYIRNSLYNCKNHNLHVEICWIPSHMSIPGNERADALAKESLHLPNPLHL